MSTVPTAPGWYFAKWRIAAEGTRDGDEITPSDKIECVEVWVNHMHEDEPDYLRVSVAGVETSQPLDGFFWIGSVPMPGGGQ